MNSLFAMDFMQYVVATGLCLSILYGCLSFFIVTKKMVFLGAGIAHTAFGGVALGILLHVNPFYTALAFCVSSALIIGLLVKHARISYDSGIGIFFSFAMALGAVLIALRKAYTFDLTGYLFGNILGVTLFDLIVVIIITILFLAFIGLFMKRILFVTFDERVATVSGIASEVLELTLLLFLAVIIVVSIKMIGIVLVSALIVLPASVGKLLSNNYRHVILAGVLFLAVIMMGGLMVAYQLDIPIGATIVLLGTLVFFGLFIVKRFKKG